MPAKALWRTAINRDDIDRIGARAIRSKGDPAAVRGKMGVTFHGRGAGDAAGFTPGTIRDPEISAVNEGNVLFAQAGLTQQAGALCIAIVYTKCQ